MGLRQASHFISASGHAVLLEVAAPQVASNYNCNLFIIHMTSVLHSIYSPYTSMMQCILHLDTKLVGPLLSSPAKPLPDDLEKFVKEVGDEGVILVSFGSILGEIDDQTIATMADAFSSLPQRVIWKLGKLP